MFLSQLSTYRVLWHLSFFNKMVKPNQKKTLTFVYLSKEMTPIIAHVHQEFSPPIASLVGPNSLLPKQMKKKLSRKYQEIIKVILLTVLHENSDELVM